MDHQKSEPSTRARFAGHTGWALVTGLALGFAIGQSVGQWRATAERNVPVEKTDHRPGPALSTSGASSPETSSAGSATTSSTSLPATSPASPSARVYASMADFPAAWLKDTDLPAGVLDGLTGSQTVSALQVLNERNCECGCRFGTLASCLKNDPGCPRSPVLAGMIDSMAKQGQPVGAILGAVDVGQSGMNRAKKARDAGSGHADHSHGPGRRMVELAAWNPRQGPAAAKVTIVEFSDFQ